MKITADRRLNIESFNINIVSLDILGSEAQNCLRTEIKHVPYAPPDMIEKRIA